MDTYTFAVAKALDFPIGGSKYAEIKQFFFYLSALKFATLALKTTIWPFCIPDIFLTIITMKSLFKVRVRSA